MLICFMLSTSIELLGVTVFLSAEEPGGWMSMPKKTHWQRNSAQWICTTGNKVGYITNYLKFESPSRPVRIGISKYYREFIYLLIDMLFCYSYLYIREWTGRTYCVTQQARTFLPISWVPQIVCAFCDTVVPVVVLHNQCNFCYLSCSGGQ